MGFLKNLFGGSSTSSAEFFTFAVRCDRCSETITGKVNLNNDLSLTHEGGYFARKVLMGGGRCFQQVEVTLNFDGSKQLVRKHVNGGRFIE